MAMELTSRVVSAILKTLESVGQDIGNGLTIDLSQVVQIGKNSAHGGLSGVLFGRGGVWGSCDSVAGRECVELVMGKRDGGRGKEQMSMGCSCLFILIWAWT